MVIYVIQQQRRSGHGGLDKIHALKIWKIPLRGILPKNCPNLSHFSFWVYFELFSNYEKDGLNVR
jgi:hypothetical protein